MLEKGKRIWALLLAVGLLAGQLGAVATAEDSPAGAQDSGQVDSGRAAFTGQVSVNGLTLAFGDGTTPELGEDFDMWLLSALHLHPKNGKELLLSGSSKSDMTVVSSYVSEIYEARIRLTNDTKAGELVLGSRGTDGTRFMTHLALNGGGYSLSDRLIITESSRIAVTGGLHVNGDICVWGGILTASGPFSQTDGNKVWIGEGALLELRDQPSADWENRLVYDDSIYVDPPPMDRGGRFLPTGNLSSTRPG